MAVRIPRVGERRTCDTFRRESMPKNPNCVSSWRWVGRNNNLAHRRVNLSDPVEGTPFDRPIENLAGPLDLLVETKLAC